MTLRTVCKILLSILPLSGVACEDVDWNWDFDWWQKPKRVVQPVRPQSRQADAEASKQTAVPPDDESPAAKKTPEQAVTDAGLEEQPVSAKDATARTAATKALGDRPVSFYQLYLTSGKESGGVELGERRLGLKNAKARECASVLEMLYVPTGRSGSDEECYLIYENRREFEAAATMAPRLDVAPIDAARATVGPEQAFQAGIGQLLWIHGQGVTVEAKLIDECERHLAEALQSTQLPPLDRWAAGIMAGRLAGDFKYDFGLAKSYYRQAEQIAAEATLERMTARWWIADSLVQERKASEAREIYQSIVRDYSDGCGTCQVVRRSTAKLEQRQKRPG